MDKYNGYLVQLTKQHSQTVYVVPPNSRGIVKGRRGPKLAFLEVEWLDVDIPNLHGEKPDANIETVPKSYVTFLSDAQGNPL